MPHSLFRHAHRGGLYAALQDGNLYWIVPYDDTTRPSELQDSGGGLNFCPTGYVDNHTTCTTAQLARVATARHQQATAILQEHSSAVSYKPLTVQQISTLLEDEYLAALVQQPQDATRVHVARTRLVGFVQMQQGTYVRKTYRYSLPDNFVGETAHIHAAWKLKTTDLTVQYRCTTAPASQRFTTFMRDVAAVAGGAANDAKTHINEYLIAPRTAGRSAQAHEEVLRSFVAGISANRRNEIAQWVAAQFAGHAGDPARVRVAIWVRNVTDGGHAADQNMSRTRFRKILTALHQAGVDDIILIGDELPHANWTQQPAHAPHYTVDGAHGSGRIFDFSQLWSGDGPLTAGVHSAPNTLRGYAEQVAVYAALYRNPDLRTHINMQCIITNKSGGPDLPSLAGIPQIQIAEMADGELMLHHRMGFQALCSHAWTVLRSPQRDPGQEQDLSGGQINELANLVRRAVRLRTWHLNKLGQQRFTWVR